MTHRSPAPRLVRLATLGSLLGGLASIMGIMGCQFLWIHDDDALALCDDIYADCMAQATTLEHEQACAQEVQDCYEGCEAGWDDRDGADEAQEADDGAASSAGSGEPSTDEGAPDTGTPDGESTTGDDPIPDACYELHATCIEQAETLADVEACEALFEQCSNPGECPMCGCPDGALEACLSSYAACADAAASEAEVDACAQSFDACVAPFADACSVAENPNLDACLDQHALCVACASSDDQLAACQTTFDACMLQL